jgi:hypothetical protein
MPLTLYALNEYPDEIAVTKAAGLLPEGHFFLDFSRPLERRRWLGIINRRVGFTIDIMVPVVHEHERDGGYVFGLRRDEAYFHDIQRLWKQNYPRARSMAGTEADRLTIIAEFGRHFVEDSQAFDLRQ